MVLLAPSGGSGLSSGEEENEVYLELQTLAKEWGGLGLGCVNLASALLGAFARKAHSRNLAPSFVTMN